MKRTARVCRVLVAGLLALPAVATAAWRSEGPFVASITDVAVDGTKPDTIYAATSAGGVCRSDDAGRTWTLPGDGMVSRSVRWIEVDPRDPATLWAGVKATGRPGFWRSSDRGKTWAPVRVDATSYAVGQRIAFAASKPGIIFVPSTNLHYRTTDGGKTWQSFRVSGQEGIGSLIFGDGEADGRSGLERCPGAAPRRCRPRARALKERRGISGARFGGG